MNDFHQHLPEYRRQLQRGAIPAAYKGLLEYMGSLRAHFESVEKRLTIPGGLYQGYMDMTYFSIVTEPLKQRRLKVAVVFLHQAFRFEAWLSGVNKQVQAEYWQRIRESGWDAYRLVPSLKGADSILETVLLEEPDFSDPQALTRALEPRILEFVNAVEAFLQVHDH